MAGLPQAAWRACVLALALAMGSNAAWPAQAQAQAQVVGEAARIQRERAEVASRYAAAAAACQRRFVVGVCLDAARSERRAALDDLNHQQQVVDDARRRERAAERSQAISRKAEQADARGRAGRERAPAPSAPILAAGASADQASRPVHKQAGVVQNVDKAAAKRAAKATKFEQRRVQAELHQQQVLRRNAEHDRKRPAAAALPVPEVASAAR